MRFFWAIIFLISAMVCVVLGVGQQTFLKPDETVTSSFSVETSNPVVVLDGSILGNRAGIVTITASGASGNLDAGIGSTYDVNAWVEDAKVTTVSMSNHQVSQADSGTEKTVPSFAGSDLWSNEGTGSGVVQVSGLASTDSSAIFQSDGTAAAPTEYIVSWYAPIDTPWAVPLMGVGLGLLIIGLILMAIAIYHNHIWNGPRRKSRRISRKATAGRGKKPTSAPKGRHAAPRLAVRVVAALTVGAVGFGMTGCTAGSADTDGQSATATGGISSDQPPIDQDQFQLILNRISDTAATADSTLDANLAGTRFVDSALQARQAIYRVRAVDSTTTAAPAIPDGDVKLFVPQASRSWPRSVFAILDDPASDAAALAITMVQDSPRTNYKVSYVSEVVDSADFPGFADSSVGSVSLPPTTGLLLAAPNQVGIMYGDVLTNGANSTYASLFNTTNDQFLAASQSRETSAAGELAGKGNMSFVRSASGATPISFATSDSGAVVAVSIDDSEISVPTAGNEVTAGTAALKTLLGKDNTTIGIKATYLVQMLFSVPPVGSNSQIVLLAVTQSLVSVTESAG